MIKEEGNALLRAEVGQDVSLFCNYQMMGDTLYSIKWYRDDKEFFRYIPRGEKTLKFEIKSEDCILFWLF